MGNSRKSLSPEAVVSSFVERTVSRGERVVLGLSGGLDSVVLLHVLKTFVPAFSLSCLHVNHKISKNAENWANFCEDLCRKWHVPIMIEEVDISPHLASGLEAAARAARYEVFGRIDADHVFLAQHRDDQAETVLLQLARGAGLRGLAAMGESTACGNKFIRRPFLSISRSALEAYARENNLEWVNDESNADLRFDRNFVRLRLIPLMEERFPAARETVSRTAGHIAEAARLLDELADMDGSGARRAGCLEVSRLFELSEARAKNLLRRHLFLCGTRMPSAERLREMLKQLRSESACVSHDGFEVRSYRGLIHVVRPLSVASDFSRTWTGEPRMHLDELGGILAFEEGAGGLDPEKLGEPVTVRVRQGGEKFVVQENRPRRSLKNLFQEHGIPPWERNRLPLLYCGETLIWIPGIGIDPRYRSERGLLPGWEPR